MKHIPNVITTIRIIIIPFFCYYLLTDRVLIAGILLVASGLSDLVDGYLARKYNWISDLGKWLDPIADKATLFATLICVWIRLHNENQFITPLFAIMIAKELIMLVGGLVVKLVRKDIIPSQMWGKVATVVFYVNMCVVVLLMSFAEGPAADAAITALALFAAIVMVYALVRYFIVALKLLKQGGGEEIREYNEKAKSKTNKTTN